ncbi:pestheic acid cluster transcriptional regulator [Arthroderma uncinatum]|uniref:pestheic acid cluster transcriptional regulator n=1 Tax=Arthroderma uncinatum TaxID=74035 RepID=UPI00144AC794|nr:pestheic acid cluster transcriptional regulator [Arthroderma uncinatum]KAF3481174.1 pestheic acid cluster transcriptional regulator [Arthroderma uncinatum]
MSQPQPQAQPQTQPRTRKVTTRSRNGCWTCRARRKKCDEKRPFCTPCERKSLQCSGYGPRLKWGNGVASRGYLMGSAIPVHPKDVVSGKNEPSSSSSAQITLGAVGSNSAAKQKSPKSSPSANVGSLSQFMGVLNFSVPPAQNKTSTSSSSLSPEVKSRKPASSSSIHSSPSVATTSNTLVTAIPLNPFDEEIFEEFKEWGSQYLSHGAEAGQSPFGDILAFCTESRSLVANCLTFQLTLHPEHEDKFEEYYAKCLRLFREDVCDTKCAMKDATLIAGILLCSTGMNRCMKWTVHLNGLYSIIQYRNTLTVPSRISSEILDSIGFFDLPTHVLGRATKPLHIWRDYCRGKSGIEPNSNIPFSLIDLFSTIGQPGVELQFWTWTWNESSGQNDSNENSSRNAHPPSALTRLAWDATRLAGIISAREYKLLNYAERTEFSPTNPYQPPESENDSCPPTQFLVEAIISNLTTILTTEPQQQPLPYQQYPEQTDRQQQQQQPPQPPPQEMYEVLNLLLYPAFVAGTQHTLLTTQHKQRIEAFWQELFPDMGADGPGTPHIQVPLDILRDLWRDARGRTADMIAKERGVEIGLF